MKKIFEMENNMNKYIFGQLYHISIFIAVLFRLYPLGLYILLAENIYGVKDVIIRIQMLKQIQFQIREILKNLKEKVRTENLLNLEIPIPASTSDSLYKILIDKLSYKPLPEIKTFGNFIDEILKNTVVPNRVIDLFKIESIKIAFGNSIADEIEYFTHNNNKLLQKRENNKKYFMICIVILIAILFFKFFIKK
jgi:hypothetical protein